MQSAVAALQQQLTPRHSGPAPGAGQQSPAFVVNKQDTARLLDKGPFHPGKRPVLGDQPVDVGRRRRLQFVCGLQ